MSLKLMYITNRPEIAQIAENAGVDRIFIDLEYIGKNERQRGLDTVQSHHALQDVLLVRQIVKTAQLLVRCNPIHDELSDYPASKEEIDTIIQNGADLVMLPYFKTVKEVETFISLVNGRAKTMLLVETPEAVNCIDEILNVGGIDEVYIGLNDLSLGYGQKFMFEPLADGTVDRLCDKFKTKGLPFGFGGIASIGSGLLPSEMIIKEHYRLGSTSSILSRSFCNVNKIDDLSLINSIFVNGIAVIRQLEHKCEERRKTDYEYFLNNKIDVEQMVECIVKSLK